jgi:hypothetical protein
MDAAHQIGVLHSSVFARLAIGGFYETIVPTTFYEPLTIPFFSKTRCVKMFIVPASHFLKNTRISQEVFYEHPRMAHLLLALYPRTVKHHPDDAGGDEVHAVRRGQAR